MPSESASAPENVIAEPGKGEQVGASGRPIESSASPPPKRKRASRRGPYPLIYLIIGPTGMTYVGQTIQRLEFRWKDHVRDAKRGSKQLLETAIRQFGPEAFTVMEIECLLDVRNINAREAEAARERHAYAPEGYTARAGNGDTFHVTEVARKNMAAFQNRPEVKAANSERGKEMWQTPEMRQRINRLRTEAQQRPGAFERRSEGHRRQWTRPGARERASLAQREAQNRPEVKARMIASIKAVWSQSEEYHAWRTQRIRDGVARSKAARGANRK